jgi:cysteinyl-tRNA synthetase
MLQGIDDLLGLKLSEVSDISEEQKRMISERETARQNKDWVKSDELRDKLIEQNVGLRDTTQGVIWFPL